MQDGIDSKEFHLRDAFVVCKSIPRAVRLMWDASPALMVGMAFVTLLQGVLPLATVVIARLLIDGVLQVIQHSTIQPVILPVILQLVVYLLTRFCTRLYSAYQLLLNHRITNHITLLILRKAGTLDLASFEDAAFYDRLSHVREDAINKPLMMTMQLFSLGGGLVALLSLVGLLFQLSWWLALVVLLVPIPVFIADSRYGIRNYWMLFWQSSRKREQMYITNLLTTDTFTKEIKLFNLADFFAGRYYKLSEEMYQEDRKLQSKHVGISLLWSILPILANAGIYLYVALQAVRHLLTLGALTQYTMAINQVGQNFQGVLDNLSALYEYHLFIQTLFDFLAYKPMIVAPAEPLRLEIRPDRKGVDIEFRNVSFTYPGKSEAAVCNVSFTLRAGETAALVGHNGSGKTTLVKLLTRLYDPTEGEILIGGHNIKDYDPHELREKIGVIFQDFMRYNMTARENIGIGRVAEMTSQALVESAAQKSGADAIITRLDDGYDAMLGRWFDKGVDLSGGEWQKIALARAFMRDAPVLILDEPTSALDAQAEYDIFQRFYHLTEGCTVIVVSHRFSTVRLADRIFVMEQGRLIESGSHQELLALRGTYAELFNLQAEMYR